MSSASHHTRRVVITGVGVVSPLGLNAKTSWAALKEGRSSGGKITRFDASTCSVQIAHEIKDFDVTKLCSISPKDARKVGLFAHYALVAAHEAFADSGITTDKLNPMRIGTNIGVGMGGLPELEETHLEFLEKGFRRITPFFITQVITNLASGLVSLELGLKGPNHCSTTACASSAHAVIDCVQTIRLGDADVMLAGGAEAVICNLGIGGFAALRALSTNNDNPLTASRPYDKDRDGFVMGEGAAVLVLEEYEHAKKRGAQIYCEVLGVGASADAYHITHPSPEGEGGGRAMDAALANAKISGSQIDYVNTHGTSTPAGDPEEAQAVAKRVDAKRVNISSTKSMSGHMLGAAGAFESFVCAMTIKESIIPPTINLDNLDPACAATGLNFTAHTAVKKSVRYALSNSFGFGGTNASLVFAKI